MNEQKSFVIPTFGVELSHDLTTLMTPIALAVAIECDQLESLSQERRSAFVELGCDAHLRPESSDAILRSKHADPEEPYDLSSPMLIKHVLADPGAPKSLKESLAKTIQDLKDGKIHFS